MYQDRLSRDAKSVKISAPELATLQSFVLEAETRGRAATCGLSIARENAIDALRVAKVASFLGPANAIQDFVQVPRRSQWAPTAMVAALRAHFGASSVRKAKAGKANYINMRVGIQR